jgi:hypothetical protein
MGEYFELKEQASATRREMVSAPEVISRKLGCGQISAVIQKHD